MSLFSFYREATPEPPELDSIAEDSDEDDFDGYPPTERRSTVTTVSTTATSTGGDETLPMEVVKNLTFFQVEDERDVVTPSQTSTATQCPPAGPMAMPVELWEIIFGYMIPQAQDDSYQSVGDLLNCALTCRVWSLIALPMLYRTHGYGCLNVSNAGHSEFPIYRAVDFYNDVASQRMLQLWRTLLLSCFTASRPTSPSRFTTFTGATLFPYIKYITHLDARTLVMVLTAIMRSQRRQNAESSRDKSAQKNGELNPGAAQYFFAGAVGDFEISGEMRGERMILGGPEYTITSPVNGKEIKIFVGDTALMIMDFLYPHISHLKSFTVPELGQLRVHPPINMSHPVSLLNSFHSLSNLVISSGWMITTGLGRAIAAIRPSLLEPRHLSSTTSDFSLTILDWKMKTHYDPHYHHDEDWETNRDDYRYTVRSAVDFFNALNPCSLSSLDLDFEVRYSRQQGDLGEGTVALRQARTLKSLRLSHSRTSHTRLINVFRRMITAGFAPRALRLEELYIEDRFWDAPETASWDSVPTLYDNLQVLELSRFPGMFELAAAAIERSTQLTKQHRNRGLTVVSLWFQEKHLREACSETIMHMKLPMLAPTLTSLRLNDTDPYHPHRARRRTTYYRFYQLDESPLEALTNLKHLTLTGDIADVLLSGRLKAVLYALQDSLESLDLCLPASEVDNKTLPQFLIPTKLRKLILRHWVAAGMAGQEPAGRGLTADGVLRFLDGCGRVGGSEEGLCVLRELGLSKGFVWEEVHRKSRDWENVGRWLKKRGGRFLWGCEALPKP